MGVFGGEERGVMLGEDGVVMGMDWMFFVDGCVCIEMDGF